MRPERPEQGLTAKEKMARLNAAFDAMADGLTKDELAEMTAAMTGVKTSEGLSDPKPPCRILFWNIMHGGGSRACKIAEQISAWRPDIVSLSEFRGTPDSRSIAQCLDEAGYIHQLTTVPDDSPRWNALFLAARVPIARVSLPAAPEPDYLWLLAKIATEPAFHVGVVHMPLGDSWYPYTRALLNLVRDWQLGGGVIIGDTNCGLSCRDEDTSSSADAREKLIEPMNALNWRDVFRDFHPKVDAPTWYSSYRNGFRLDRAYVSPALQPRVVSCRYDWGRPRQSKKLSDHAAILLDLKL